jgi:hypothetical protein
MESESGGGKFQRNFPPPLSLFKTRVKNYLDD